MRDKASILAAFSPVPAMDQVKRMKMMKVEAGFKDLAADIADLVPDSPDRTAALRDLLKSKFQCIQAITHPLKPEIKGVQNVQPPQSRKEDDPQGDAGQGQGQQPS